MARKTKLKSSKWAWGVFWLLIAALILSNYFGGFVELGVWSAIVAALALALMVHCLVSLSFASLPIPIATLYYVFQGHLELPEIQFWTLAIVTVLVTCGLHVLLPRRFWTDKEFTFIWNDNKKRNRTDGDRDDDGDATIEEGNDENNPYINVQCGHVSRYMHSECLKTMELNCRCGALEVYLDNVQLSPEGAEVHANCKLGSIEVYVPGHWRVINNIGTSLGNAEVDSRLRSADKDAPLLTLSGSVTLGNIEVKRIKG
jgi:hypothetical protein